MTVFDCIGSKDFEKLLEIVGKHRPLPADLGLVRKAAETAVLIHAKGAKGIDRSTDPIGVLEERWYSSLDRGAPDFSVYDDPVYIADLWSCWVAYSRKYLQWLLYAKALPSGSIVDLIGPAARVVDLGCGFGYTAIGLRQLFPKAAIYGTQLETSYQFEVAKEIAGPYGVEIRSSAKGLAYSDLVFASEYFEHFEEPIEEIEKTIAQTSPRYLAIANSFSGRSVGHFKEYLHRGIRFDGRAMSRHFNKTLTGLGYRKLKTKIWNNRPAIWERV